MKLKIERVVEAIRRYPERFFPAAQKGILHGMNEFVTHIVRSQMSGRKSGLAGLNAPTGTLRDANRVQERGYGKSYKVGAQFGYPNAPYVTTHQRGGLFTSRGKMFTIPLTKEAQTSRPRDYGKDLHLVKTRRNQLLLMLDTGRTMRPMWVLKRTINIPKRLYIPEQFRVVGGDIIGRNIAFQLEKQAGAGISRG